MSLAHADIVRGLEHAGLSAARAVVHSSLKSFGEVKGGAATVASALLEVLKTVVVPTMLWDEGSAAVPPPAGEVIEHNAVDRELLESLPKHPRPFHPETSGCSGMGAITDSVRLSRGAVRSSHPLCSWAAAGDRAAEYVLGQTADDPYYPLRKLYSDGGKVVLLGVSLTACTALHLAEELAGRRPFVRWVLLESGQIGRTRVGGCSNGFDQLWPRLSGIFSETRIGNSRVLVAEVHTLVEAARTVIQNDPRITVCPRSCQRCLDALSGGPT